MRILSLFDGMCCGMLAMQEAGIQVDRYVAYEIDKYAIQTSSHNFPMIEHRGDVFQADFTEFSDFDFLIGGSPCTKWSIAQQSGGREVEASGVGWDLFSQYARALSEVKPRYFIYENNKSMSDAIRESITSTFGFEPICIDSALVSAQRRKRLYWVGKRNADGTYSKVNVDLPEDREILLRDVLDGVTDREKGSTVIASSDGTLVNSIEENIDKLIELCSDNPAITSECESIKKLLGRDCYELDAASVETFFNRKGNRIGRIVAADKGKHHDSQQYRVYSTDGKSVTLCSSPGSLGKMTGLYAVPVVFDGETPIKAVSRADGKTYIVYEVKDGHITINGKRYPIKLADGFYIIRNLTVSECKRLQTVPEWYEFPVSDSRARQLLGNGWTVSLIAHLINATQTNESAEEQLNMFARCSV